MWVNLPVATALANIFTLFASGYAEADDNAPTMNGTDDLQAQGPVEVTLFHNIRFGGASQKYILSPGECIGLDSNMKKEASSFKGTCAILFDRAGCTGKEIKLEGTLPKMPFGWNNEAESIGSCTGKVESGNFKNILTLYKNSHFKGGSHILQPSPGPGICGKLERAYSAWASSVKAIGCIRVWTRPGCKGIHLDISEDNENLLPIGFSDVIRSYELCSNELPRSNANFTQVFLYEESHRRGMHQILELEPGQCQNFGRFSTSRGQGWPKSVDAECAFFYNDQFCVGKRFKVIGSHLQLENVLIGADSVQSCDPGANPPNSSYVMLVRNDGLSSPVQYVIESSECINLMFEFEKTDIKSYDADCAILFDQRWCQGNHVQIKGIGQLPPSWKGAVSSVGSCVGQIQKPPANLTIVTITNERQNSTVEIPPGVCTSMTRGRQFGRVIAEKVSTTGCVYWYNTNSDCTGMRRKVEQGSLPVSDFEKGVPTWTNDYAGSFKTCSEYESGPAYVAVYENPQLNIGYNAFVGFKLEPQSCINFWGSRDKWVASIDVDCAVVFDGHWCTEEQRRIVGAVEELGNWKHRISSIGSCDGPIPTGRSENSSMIYFYAKVGFEGVKSLYDIQSGECLSFSEYDDPYSASTDSCVELFEYDRACGGIPKRLDGDIEDLRDWSKDELKYFPYLPKSGRRCKS